MQRRIFIASSAAAATAIMASKGYAWVWFIRLLFAGGRVAVGSGGRSVAAGAGRSAAQHVVRPSVALSNARLASALLSAGASALSFRSAISAQQFADYHPAAIAFVNEPSMVRLETNQSFSANIHFSVIDEFSGRVEYQQSGLCAVDSGRAFSFNIGDLPYTGIKRIHGQPADASIPSFLSDRMMIVHPSDVEVG